MSENTLAPVATVVQTYTDLPYTFDLLYDLKSVESLHAHLTGKQRQSTSATDAELIDTMIEHGIPMPEGYAPKTLAPTFHPSGAVNIEAAMVADMLVKKTGKNSLAIDLPNGGQVIVTLGDEYVDVKILAQNGDCQDMASASYNDLEPE